MTIGRPSWEQGGFAEDQERNPTPYYVAIIIAFLILLSKLWYLQVIQGTDLADQSDRHRIRDHRIPAARGIILDRNQKVLAQNRPSYNLFFHYASLPREQRLPFLEQACRDYDIDFETAKRRYEASRDNQPVKIKTDITRDEVAVIKTRSMSWGRNFPLEVEVESIREYPNGTMGAHLLGYTAEIDKKRLEMPKYEGYRPGDLVGKTGLEEEYEEYLAGVFGWKRVEVNARGMPIQELAVEKGIAGRNLVLNIDLDLMKSAQRALGSYAGAVVAMDPRDGRVIVALSNPSFAPSIFSRPIPHDVWDKLVNDPKHPLQNKFAAGMYPPGSTFKVVTALAALESGAMTPSSQVTCTGKWKFGGRDFRCHSERGHGAVNLHRAIVHSCDVYFYKVGFQMGIDVIAEYSRALGLGARTGIDIIGEKGGLVPDKKWKEETYKQGWLPGDTLSASIGQGSLLTTPLQMAVVYSVFANGGTVFRPQVLDHVEDVNGEIIRSYQPEVIRRLNVSKRNLRLVHGGLVGVVNEPGGTGGRARLSSVTVAGKTGTSQVRAIGTVRKHVSTLAYEHRDHAWFVCYAPAEDPEIVVAVLVEHAGHGGVMAAPIANQVLGSYFQLKRKREGRPEPEAAQVVGVGDEGDEGFEAPPDEPGPPTGDGFATD